VRGLARAGLAVGLALLGPRPANGQDPAAASLARGDGWFAEARLDAARAEYDRALEGAGPEVEARARLGLGRIALLEDRLDDAVREFEDARAAGAADSTASSAVPLLAEARVRRGELARAAELWRQAGRIPRADQLDALAERAPYALTGPERVEIPFVRTDPLPVVQLRVNGGPPAYFILDTGASELILDPGLADSVGALRFGVETGEFAAGKKAGFEYGLVDSVQAVGLTVRDVPVHVLATRGFSAAAGGLPIDGVVGTAFLYRFRATLDYPGRRLVLERRDVAEAARTGDEIDVPLWLAGDHFLLAPGSVGDAAPTVLLVDTGLAGGGFAAPPSTLAEAGIEVEGEAAATGVGGGGAVRVVPFTVDRLSLGGLARGPIVGFAGVFPESLERAFGFRVGGLVSHEFLRPYAVTLDFERMLLRLKPAPCPAAAGEP